MTLHYVPESFRSTGESLFEGGQRFMGGLERRFHYGMGRLMGGGDGGEEGDGEQSRGGYGDGSESNLHIQLTRSCCEWSSGHKIEHSIANAYIDAITNAEHFVYIENQFFITATSDDQHPVTNKIGRAIVQRILRAHNDGEDFGMVVCMPAVPGFAGDLKSDGALGTRAIMEYQYNSISRGENSIYGALIASGVPDPTRYLRFYNLRNYDRINTAPLMGRAEAASGVAYQDARREFDDAVEAGYDGYGREGEGEGEGERDGYGNGDRYGNGGRYGGNYGGNYGGDYGSDNGGRYGGDYGGGDGGGYGGGRGSTIHGRLGDKYRRYQEAAADAARDEPDLLKTADTVSAAYMDGGPDLTACGWTGEGDGGDAELAAFVSEELYIHTKVLIADDRLVIVGSANLNDRSQLGSHDSEIAVIIEDPAHPVASTMAGQPYEVGAFPASLRRQLFRKHIGLLPDQRWDEPTPNFLPVTMVPTNKYDWESPSDQLVADPLSEEFTQLWQGTAATNTAAFEDVFHCVPSDRARNWDEYESYFSQYFTMPGAEEGAGEKLKDKGEEEKEKIEAAFDHVTGSRPASPSAEEGSESSKPTKVEYGHVVPDYPGGVTAVKARLAEVRGNLVEMPLEFLVDVKDLAKQGLALNSLTDELYT